ncbi:unnamed protein product, partial [Thlaspi arvense]
GTRKAMSIVVDVTRVSDMNAVQYGDIETLYKLIAEDPNILGHLDKVPFCETPLHIATKKGQTHFAMELMTLKPSLASKLNASGFSPMHLALHNNHVRMVRGFVAIDSSLVSIKERGRITPLHHVAGIGDAELLSEFLLTSVQIAVKNHQLMAFKVLLGWVKRVNKKEILDWKDEDGNTVFHIAASINHTEFLLSSKKSCLDIAIRFFILKLLWLLHKTAKNKAKNLDGKTAMDRLRTHQSPCFPKARKFFHNVRERLPCCSTMTLAGYLSKNLSFIENRNNLLGLSNLCMIGDMSINSSNLRDAILVVAILIVTATYQAGLSPPGRFWQDDANDHYAGKMTMSFSDALFFVVPNAVAFLSSLYVIIVLIIGLPMWNGGLEYRYICIIQHYITESTGHLRIYITMLFATFMAFIVDKRRRYQVDFPASCFNSSGGEHHLYLLLFIGLCVIVVVRVTGQLILILN